MINAEQIRAARALLDWSTADLAKQSGLTVNGINKIERGHVQAHRETLEKIQKIFQGAGVAFFGDRGLELKNDEIVTLKGENIFFRVLDDVITTLQGTKNSEALFACVDDKVSPPAVIENYKRLRKAGISMRSLVKEGNAYLMGDPKEYRYLPEQFFHNNATVIYGEKFATMILDPATNADVAAIIIRNTSVAAAQRNLFNLIWSDAEKPSRTDAQVRYDE